MWSQGIVNVLNDSVKYRNGIVTLRRAVYRYGRLLLSKAKVRLCEVM